MLLSPLKPALVVAISSPSVEWTCSESSPQILPRRSLTFLQFSHAPLGTCIGVECLTECRIRALFIKSTNPIDSHCQLPGIELQVSLMAFVPGDNLIL